MAAQAVKWPGSRPRRPRPYARSSPGRAPGWSSRTITMALQALTFVAEREEGGFYGDGGKTILPLYRHAQAGRRT